MGILEQLIIDDLGAVSDHTQYDNRERKLIDKVLDSSIGGSATMFSEKTICDTEKKKISEGYIIPDSGYGFFHLQDSVEQIGLSGHYISLKRLGKETEKYMSYEAGSISNGLGAAVGYVSCATYDDHGLDYEVITAALGATVGYKGVDKLSWVDDVATVVIPDVAAVASLALATAKLSLNI